jgi:hypothetical protein
VRAKSRPPRRAAARPRPTAKRPPRRAGRPPAAPRPASSAPARRPPPPRSAPARPLIERERRRLSDDERFENEARAAAADDRLTAEARSGRRGLKAALARHSESDPSLTAGDIDARWDDAYAVGDEAPGGDNPTPDQDRVDDIGKALGVTYQDAEELKGSTKIEERDRHRWELDPASSDDWPHDREPKE